MFTVSAFLMIFNFFPFDVKLLVLPPDFCTSQASLSQRAVYSHCEEKRGCWGCTQRGTEGKETWHRLSSDLPNLRSDQSQPESFP